MTGASPTIRARPSGSAVPRGVCRPLATPGLPVGAIPALIDVEPETLGCEDAEAVLFARLEGLLEPSAAATIEPHVNKSISAQNANDERRSS